MLTLGGHQRPAPGLVVLHSNQQESLKSVLVEWLGQHPLSVFENEELLVQSNGIGQWLKLALSADQSDGGLGIAANIKFSLPSMFIWRSYRAVLGSDHVPKQSPYDKQRLTWRLFRLLASLPQEKAYEPLRLFIDTDPSQNKRWQLAEQLADLYDQYQIYRGDWLNAWSEGRDITYSATGEATSLNDQDLWQASLWRLIRCDLGQDADLSRADLHAQFLDRCLKGQFDPKGLPPRLIIFGVSALPLQILEALHALAEHIQILCCVLNPCQHYWADIIDGRELLTADRKRQAQKPNMVMSQSVPQGHPLLAAWGKQGRDFMRLLDLFDESHHYQSQFGLNKIDLFEPPIDDGFILHRIQQDILDLEPPNQSPLSLAKHDHSLRFVKAYSAQREVEILQDQLIEALNLDSSLHPRDILVMVPEIESYRAQIESVFGWLDLHDPRFIPFSISDQSVESTHPILKAVEVVTSLQQRRLGVTDLLALLELDAVRERFKIDKSALPYLSDWIRGAGIRWGLNGQHRSLQGFSESQDQNTWLHGLQRMLVGFALGDATQWEGVEPFTKVRGVNAESVGGLAQLVRRLSDWCKTLDADKSVDTWVDQLQQLLTDLLSPTEANDQLIYSRLLSELGELKTMAFDAGITQKFPLLILGSQLLKQVESPSLNKRFMAGGITFATLMPMRAIPFRRIYLLGMQEGAYPRTQVRNDFDLMSRTGSFRPGDRSRRDDDRYLFLEALLSARDYLGVSWVAKSIFDNSDKPPSVLVAQLRDFISENWSIEGQSGEAVLDYLTQLHPLQPFAVSYFEKDKALSTYAHEWRLCHQPHPKADPVIHNVEPESRILISELTQFLTKPARYWFKQRFGSTLTKPEETPLDCEPFEVAGLDDYQIKATAMTWFKEAPNHDENDAIEHVINRLMHCGLLPWGGFADRHCRAIRSHLKALIRHRGWVLQDQAWVLDTSRRIVLEIDDRSVYGESGELFRTDDQCMVLHESAGAVITKGRVRFEKLAPFWIHHLVLNAHYRHCSTRLVGPDGVVELKPLEVNQAIECLNTIDQKRMAMLHKPLPLVMRTGLSVVNDGIDAARSTYEGGFNQVGDSKREPELEALWQDYDHMVAEGLEHHAYSLYGPLIDCADIWREGSR